MESLTFISAIVLGAVQGFTEFLPVSSSGHLVIFQKLLGFSEPALLFDVLLHFATLAAVVIFFRHTIRKLSLRLWLLIGLATIPAVVGGLLMEAYLDAFFTSLILLGLGFLLTAYWVYQTDHLPQSNHHLNQLKPASAGIIGIFQAIALLPSVSRSGATIYAGLKTGLSRDAAVSFAFILSIPAILGANVYALSQLPPDTNLAWLPVLAGMFTAFLTGLISLKLLRRLVLEARLWPFALYTAVLGIVCIIWGIMV